MGNITVGTDLPAVFKKLKSQTNEDKIGPVTAAETPSDLFVFSIL